MSKAEEIPSQDMEQNRILARYLLILLLIPLLVSKINEIYYNYQNGYSWTTIDILFDGIVIISYLAMLYFFPLFTPIFENKYILTPKVLRMSRFLKPGDPINISDINRVEFYKTRGKDDKDKILKIYHERVTELTKSGFKREDFTNTSENIVILLSKEKFYQMTPKYPKTFIDKLRKTKPDLPVKQIEIFERGKRESDI